MRLVRLRQAHVRPSKEGLQPLKTEQASRNFKCLNVEDFLHDLQRDLIDEMPTESGCDEMVEHYELTLKNTIDKYCPLSVKMRTIRPRKPWYNNTVHEARRVRRRLENKWKKRKAVSDKDSYLEQKVLVDGMITKAKSEYFQDKLFSANSKEQFKVLNSLLNTGTKILPRYECVPTLLISLLVSLLRKSRKLETGLTWD